MCCRSFVRNVAHKFRRTIGWFRENNEISCPCGTTNYLVTEELVRIIEELKGAIGRLIRPTPENRKLTGSGKLNSLVTGRCGRDALRELLDMEERPVAALPRAA